MGETDNDQKGKATAPTSAGTDGTTSVTTRTYTQEQMEKIRSDALAEAGRANKAAQEAARIARESTERLTRYEQERYDRELEDAKDDPDRLRDVQRKQRIARQEADFEERKRQFDSEKVTHDERIKRAEAIERRELAREVAAEFGVDAKLLERYGTDKESMVELAKDLPKAVNGEDGKAKQGNRVTTPPDRGTTTGGAKELKVADVAKMSPEEQVRRSKEIAAIPFGSE